MVARGKAGKRTRLVHHKLDILVEVDTSAVMASDHKVVDTFVGVEHHTQGILAGVACLGSHTPVVVVVVAHNMVAMEQAAVVHKYFQDNQTVVMVRQDIETE
jgi:hypothetical protein